jgi:hypothetical protein
MCFQFDVRLPEDFDVVSAKKAWPKRRRSQSPLLVGVKLEQEDQILGSGGGGVTTLLRVSQVGGLAFLLVSFL